MCGRVNVSDHPGVIALLEILDIPLYPDSLSPRYNIAPGASLFTAFASQNHYEGAIMEWGIVPTWAKPDKFSRPLINARSDTIWEKPSFRNLIKSQRVIIPINGFYEWKREEKKKTAFHIHSANSPTLAVGGIYQISKDGVMQCCVVTTDANASMSEVHDRQPVILKPELMKDWLNSTDKTYLNQLMLPCEEGMIKIDKISSYVNNANNEGPKCLEALPDEDQPFKLI